MKNKDTGIFDYLNYIFKSSDNEPKDVKVSPYLINRWVSMANPVFSVIANATLNRWCMVSKDFDVKRFYRILLPIHKRNISYIKKAFNDKVEDVDENIANVMECSQREIILFNETLAQLNIVSK